LFLRQFNHCLTGNAFDHIQHIITNTICQWLIPQQPNKTTPPMVNQRLHPSDPAAPQPPANSLTSRSLFAACRPTLVLAIAARHLVSDPALINTPPTVPIKLNMVSILCFDWLNTILAAPRQQLSEMADGMAMVMADGNGNCDGRQ
jgi:hypothetical protein